MSPAGIEPVTFRFVAQRLNHCATAVPRLNINIHLNIILPFTPGSPKWPLSVRLKRNDKRRFIKGPHTRNRGVLEGVCRGKKQYYYCCCFVLNASSHTWINFMCVIIVTLRESNQYLWKQPPSLVNWKLYQLACNRKVKQIFIFTPKYRKLYLRFSLRGLWKNNWYF